jgi:hypothetical protein
MSSIGFSVRVVASGFLRVVGVASSMCCVAVDLRVGVVLAVVIAVVLALLLAVANDELWSPALVSGTGLRRWSPALLS